MHTQLCLTLCEPMDCSPLGSSLHGILHSRILEWVAISSSRGSSWPRDQPRDWTHQCVSCTGRQILYHWATWERTQVALSPNRVIMVAPQPYQWCWSPFFYKSDLQTLCINQRRERRGRLKLIEWSKNKLTGKHILIFKTEKVATYLWNYHCRIYYKRVRSADSRELLFIETEQSAGVGMSTLVRRRPWTGGPRLSRHLEVETRPAWSSYLYQAVLGEQQASFLTPMLTHYLPQRLKLYFRSCFSLSLQGISASEVLGALGAIQGFPGSVIKNPLAVLGMQETGVWSLGQEDPLEEGMATQDSILAWRIPWTEEPGRLQSMGSQRVGHNWSELAAAAGSRQETFS